MTRPKRGMKPVSGLELFDYLEILRKRFWMVFVCIVVGLLGAGAVFSVTPKVYRSSALILVESQKVPTDLIKPVTADTIEERLISIQQQILSRTLLQKIIEEFNLYKNDLKSKPIEDVIDDMRKDIKVTIVDDRRMLHIQAFSLAYEGNNPRIVMQVTNRKTTIAPIDAKTSRMAIPIPFRMSLTAPPPGPGRATAPTRRPAR